MKRLILCAAMLAALAIAGSAAADVPRYQMQTMTLTAVQPEYTLGQWTTVWTHTYTDVVLNPCDGSFSGEGTLAGTLFGPYPGAETITGHLDGDTVSFTATRSYDGVEYSLTDAPLDGTTVTLATSIPAVPWDLEFKVSATDPVNSTHYRNHGDYVSQMGGGADAAHSCIGMPIG